ncbi:hypothetical protein AALP_AAs39051U000100 [Arabis alpina]|uniref:Uncharacterized protein n=1 Tax=Arabis alpina TaxID=50452 RepID=A0A087FYH6_ARAAL|nr:hypothetical protein AALP_AAs39051U000100 [Arabis alpina]
MENRKTSSMTWEELWEDLRRPISAHSEPENRKSPPVTLESLSTLLTTPISLQSKFQKQSKERSMTFDDKFDAKLVSVMEYLKKVEAYIVPVEESICATESIDAYMATETSCEKEAIHEQGTFTHWRRMEQPLMSSSLCTIRRRHNVGDLEHRICGDTKLIFVCVMKYEFGLVNLQSRNQSGVVGLVSRSLTEAMLHCSIIVAYRLRLLEGSKILDACHISQLKTVLGAGQFVSPLPLLLAQNEELVIVVGLSP